MFDAIREGLRLSSKLDEATQTVKRDRKDIESATQDAVKNAIQGVQDDKKNASTLIGRLNTFYDDHPISGTVVKFLNFFSGKFNLTKSSEKQILQLNLVLTNKGIGVTTNPLYGKNLSNIYSNFPRKMENEKEAASDRSYNFESESDIESSDVDLEKEPLIKRNDTHAFAQELTSLIQEQDKDRFISYLGHKTLQNEERRNFILNRLRTIAPEQKPIQLAPKEFDFGNRCFIISLLEDPDDPLDVSLQAGKIVPLQTTPLALSRALDQYFNNHSEINKNLKKNILDYALNIEDLNERRNKLNQLYDIAYKEKSIDHFITAIQ